MDFDKHDPIITLLTDFGDADGFVGVLRAVLLARAPGARLVDVAHHVPRGDVAKAARVLARAAPWFPVGTVHLAVVDPGVGSARGAVVVQAGGHLFVAPDNGLVQLVARQLGGVEAAHLITAAALLEPRRRGSTFHGRDVFAPVAGALAAGASLADVGPAIEPAALVRLPPAGPRQTAEGWLGEVVEVDQYGNLITDLPPPPPGETVVVTLGDVALEGPRAAYAEVVSGALVVVVGSEGTLEVAVRDGSAAARLGLDAGAPVACQARPRGPS